MCSKGAFLSKVQYLCPSIGMLYIIHTSEMSLMFLNQFSSLPRNFTEFEKLNFNIDLCF
jgi:hypothetical protein